MSQIYEDPKLLDEYLLFHYGRKEEILDAQVNWPDGMAQALDFAVRTPSHFSTNTVKIGLDLGCAVGRSTFEMSRHCEKVIGLDYSHQFIAAAKQMKSEGKISYLRLDEASLKVGLNAELPVYIDPTKVDFMQGDASCLPHDLGEFDRVHAANLLCRMKDPVRLLERLGGLVKKEGELCLATPCTWLEQFTPRGKWPETNTLEWLKKHLTDSFDLKIQVDEPFLIRETARKFQWTRSMLTIWKKK